MQYIKDYEYRCNLYITKIKQFNTRIFNHFLQEMGYTDFTCEQSFILQVLWKKQKATCNEIAKESGLAANTITALVNNLIKNDMVIREKNPKDRREVIVSITQKGLESKKVFDLVLSKIITIGFADFSFEEYEKFQSYLEKICSHYEEFFNSPQGEEK